MWETFTGLTEHEMDALYSVSGNELRKPMNMRGDYSVEENICRHRYGRDTSEKVILIIFIHFLCGGNEGGIGLGAASCLYEISVRTLNS